MKKFDSKFSKATESTGFLLWKVSNIHQRKQRKALAVLGITPTQFSVLACYFYIAQTHTPITQADVSHYSGIDKMQVSDVTKALERLGLVKKHSHPSDKRSSVISVTAAGQKKCNQALKLIEELDKEFFSVCENINLFSQNLRRISEVKLQP